MAKSLYCIFFPSRIPIVRELILSTNPYDLNNSQIQRLEKVIYENKKLLQDEIEALNALEDYVKCQPVIEIEQPPENNEEEAESPNTKTYIRQVQY